MNELEKALMDELDKASEAYEQIFGEYFPTFPMRTRPPNEIIDIINKCISAKKDVYEMGYLSLDTIY